MLLWGEAADPSHNIRWHNKKFDKLSAFKDA
jgi:hypothetical protein